MGNAKLHHHSSTNYRSTSGLPNKKSRLPPCVYYSDKRLLYSFRDDKLPIAYLRTNRRRCRLLERGPFRLTPGT